MEWINNQWLIGIGTSIISGFLVFFFTRKFFTEKQKKEYEQKIKTANNEILYSVRPLIVEKTKPTLRVLKSVLISTARKYGVELTDIYNRETLCDDLTNEIMSNSFLSSDQKLELSLMISEFKEEGEQKSEPKVVTIYKDSKSNTSTTMAFTLSIMTAMFALTFTIFSTISDSKELFSTSEKFPAYISILFLALIIPLTALMMTTFLKYIRDKEKQRGVEKSKMIEKKENEDSSRRKNENAT